MACSACVTGTLHEGTPTGNETTLYGLPTYVASPPSGTSTKGTIVIIPDAFGWNFKNNRVLADSYAEKGNFRVLLPDFMGGSGLSPNVLTYMDGIMKKHKSWGMHSLWKIVYVGQAMYHFIPWKFATGFPKTHPRVLDFMKKLREEDESENVGVAGFCWGGKHVFLLASDVEKTKSGKSLFDAGFAAHPSFLEFPKDTEAVKLPLSVAIGTVDVQIKKEKIPELEAGLRKGPAEYEVKIYEDATHGFAVRANPEVPKENEQGIEAEDQAIAWFNKTFS